MNKLINTAWCLTAVGVLICAFMFGREYQLNRFQELMGKVSQERYCTSDYYISNGSEWADFDGYCLDYTNKRGANND
jgi:hypothetical protein